MPFGEEHDRERAEDHPEHEREPEAVLASEPAGERAGEEANERARKQEQAGLGRARAEAVVDGAPLLRLDELRHEHVSREKGEPGDEPGRVGERDRSLGERAQVDQRLRDAPLERNPHCQGDGGEGEERDEDHREQRRPGHVHAGRRLDRRLGHEADHGKHPGRHHDGRDPEQPAPREVVDEDPCEGQAKPARGAEDR
jgi:hypothetical protein